MVKKIADLSATNREIYTKLLEWLCTHWYNVPINDNVVMQMANRYTPEEAEYLTGFPLKPKTLEDLAVIKNTGVEELRKKLDELAGKGLLFSFTKNDKRYYFLNDLQTSSRAWGWAGPSPTPENKDYAWLVNTSLPHWMAPYENIQEKGLRVIPIQHTIEDDRQILPYEDIRKVLESYSYFCVTHCMCRERHALGDPDYDCKFPLDLCLHFDALAHYIVDNGIGREITRKEAADILRTAADLGLVHGISNHQTGTDTICNCCRDCCNWFEGFYKLKHSGSLSPSNYHIQTNDQTCTGCGLCVKRCPMEALQMEDAPSVKSRETLVVGEDGKKRTLTNKTGRLTGANIDLCIGCGVCAYKCPSKSLTLVRNEIEHHPPATGRDWVAHYVAGAASFRQGHNA